MQRRLTFLALAGAIAVGAGPAAAAGRACAPMVAAESAAPAPGALAPAAATPLPGALALARAGFVVGIDPETGLLGMPSAEQLEALAAKMLRMHPSAHGRPMPVLEADGSTRLDVRTWMREHSVARIGRDGRIAFGCVDAQAAKALTRTPAPAAGPEEE